MPFSVTDLKLPADKLTQLERALGGKAGDEAAPKLQGICDEAVATVARLTIGYVLDPVDISGFIRAIALGRAYGQVGTIPKDVEKNEKAALDELTAIAEGKRPNLPKVVAPSQSTIGGGWGSNPKLPGRMS